MSAVWSATSSHVAGASVKIGGGGLGWGGKGGLGGGEGGFPGSLCDGPLNTSRTLTSFSSPAARVRVLAVGSDHHHDSYVMIVYVMKKVTVKFFLCHEDYVMLNML